MKAVKIGKLKRQAEYCGKASRILDIGFSANQNVFLKNAVGLDIRLPAQVAANYVASVAHNLNSGPMPFPDASFDALVAGDVIEHVENPSAFLRDASRVLVDGGRLVISTPQANDWWTTLHNWLFRRWINDPDQGEHLQNWTILDMQRLLRKNGFDILKIEGHRLRFMFVPFSLPVRHFPILSWQVFYVAVKRRSPNSEVLVKIDGQSLNVSQ